MKCRTCMADKPDDAFYMSNKTRCKECVKAAVRENRLNNIDHYRSFDRGRANLPHRVDARIKYRQTDAYRISHALATKKWKVANAIRRQAHLKVRSAIREGALVPEPCFVCGAKAEAHHPDYDAPLAVSWLCPPHHKQAHALMKELIR